MHCSLRCQSEQDIYQRRRAVRVPPPSCLLRWVLRSESWLLMLLHTCSPQVGRSILIIPSFRLSKVPANAEFRQWWNSSRHIKGLLNAIQINGARVKCTWSMISASVKRRTVRIITENFQLCHSYCQCMGRVTSNLKEDNWFTVLDCNIWSD